MNKQYKMLDEIEFGERDAANYTNSLGRDLFNRLFVSDDKMNAILEHNKYYVIGDKGTGKTAYSVYLENNPTPERIATVVNMRDTDYEKFVRLKKTNNLILSDYTDVWKLIILLLFADKIRKSEDTTIWNHLKFSAIDNAIDNFYLYAFSPEITYAIQIAEESGKSAELIHSLLKAQISSESSISFANTRFQNNIYYMIKQFSDALLDVKTKKEYLIFIDGVDVRPQDIPYKEYLECIKGLADAIWQINTTVFQRDKRLRKFRVILLIRPDIFEEIGMHNMNNKLIDNSVILEWKTTYNDYRSSGLFRMADRLFKGQQDNTSNYEEGEAWDHYFPYKRFNFSLKQSSDSSFIDFLRYSFYRPRDIIAFLSIMKNYLPEGRVCFSAADFDNNQVQKDYSNYLLGEIKDNLSFYHGSNDFDMFRNFFSFLKDYVDQDARVFTYENYIFAFNKFIAHNKQQGIEISQIFKTADYFLQMLFELNIISYLEDPTPPYKKPFIRMYFRERTYSNIRPRVKINCEYKLHKGIAKALYVISG